MNLRARINALVALVPTPARRLMGIWVGSRLNGVAAECAFWITFTLPWIVLGLLSSVGLIASHTDPSVVTQVESAVLDAAGRVLTPQAAEAYLKPMLDQLAAGRTDLTFIGLIIALWSGSRMVASLTQGIAVVHGEPGHAGYARNRGLGLMVYAVGLIAAAIAVALLAVGPDRIMTSMGMDGAAPYVSSVVVGFFLLLLLVFLLRVSAPVKSPLRLDIIGGLVALAGWVIGSVGLHFYTDHLFSDFSVYAAAGAPIAILLWSYVTAMAVMIGAAVSVALDTSVTVPPWPPVKSEWGAEPMGLMESRESTAGDAAISAKPAEN